MSAGETALLGVSPGDPVYDGLSGVEAESVRARIFARLSIDGAPPAEAIEAAREELTYGERALTVAAAALLLGAHDCRATTGANFEKAAARLRSHDVTFDLDVGRPAACVTALDVLHRCAAQAGARAACCGADEPVVTSPPFEPVDLSPLAEFPLEDQDGERFKFDALFFGRPGFLTFFYTRCQIPEKCSATVHRLGRLARSAPQDAMLAALTYDPAYDNAARLRAYGANRGVAFAPNVKLLRSVGDLAPIRERLALGVGYGPSTVNGHRLEAYVIDRRGRAVRAVLRRAWHENEALRALRAVRDQDRDS